MLELNHKVANGSICGCLLQLLVFVAFSCLIIRVYITQKVDETNMIHHGAEIFYITKTDNFAPV